MNKRILSSLVSFFILALPICSQIVDYKALNRKSNPKVNYSSPKEVKLDKDGKELIFKESLFISLGAGMQGLLVNELYIII